MINIIALSLLFLLSHCEKEIAVTPDTWGATLEAPQWNCLGTITDNTDSIAMVKFTGVLEKNTHTLNHARLGILLLPQSRQEEVDTLLKSTIRKASKDADSLIVYDQETIGPNKSKDFFILFNHEHLGWLHKKKQAYLLLRGEHTVLRSSAGTPIDLDYSKWPAYCLEMHKISYQQDNEDSLHLKGAWNSNGSAPEEAGFLIIPEGQMSPVDLIKDVLQKKWTWPSVTANKLHFINNTPAAIVGTSNKGVNIIEANIQAKGLASNKTYRVYSYTKEGNHYFVSNAYKEFKKGAITVYLDNTEYQINYKKQKIYRITNCEKILLHPLDYDDSEIMKAVIRRHYSQAIDKYLAHFGIIKLDLIGLKFFRNDIKEVTGIEWWSVYPKEKINNCGMLITPESTQKSAKDLINIIRTHQEALKTNGFVQQDNVGVVLGGSEKKLGRGLIAYCQARENTQCIFYVWTLSKDKKHVLINEGKKHTFGEDWTQPRKTSY